MILDKFSCFWTNWIWPKFWNYWVYQFCRMLAHCWMSKIKLSPQFDFGDKNVVCHYFFKFSPLLIFLTIERSFSAVFQFWQENSRFFIISSTFSEKWLHQITHNSFELVKHLSLVFLLLFSICNIFPFCVTRSQSNKVKFHQSLSTMF